MVGGGVRPEVRRRSPPAAGLRALRGGAEHAGHDGHGLNLGLCPRVERALRREGVDATALDGLRQRFDEQYATVIGRPASSDPHEQLREAASAVFASWDSARARAYRDYLGIPHEGGTAVTVQAMVLGNLNDRSGTGVLFSRNPLVGTPEPFGEYLPRGQGEEVVSGCRDPLPLRALGEREPALLAELLGLARRLERDAADVQDVEFTVQSGELFLLQTRRAKRSVGGGRAVRRALRRGGADRP